jgi:FkbM family methyltransferase
MVFPMLGAVKQLLAQKGVCIKRLGFRYLQGDVSQNMEYSFLNSIIDQEWPLIVVDVGANDGITYSNSYNFIKNGYYGVLIEPNVTLHRKIESNLRGTNYKLFPFAASSVEGKAILRMDRLSGDKQLMASISKDENEWLNNVLSENWVEIETRRLDYMLELANVQKDFTLLSVDTEGHDLEVLSSLGQWSPKIIVSEIFTWNKDSYHKKMNWFVENKYLFVGHIGCNEVFVRFDCFVPGKYNLFGHHL